MAWIEAQIRSWQAVIDSLNAKGGCPTYLERAYRTRDGYLRLLRQR